MLSAEVMIWHSSRSWFVLQVPLAVQLSCLWLCPKFWWKIRWPMVDLIKHLVETLKFLEIFRMISTCRFFFSSPSSPFRICNSRVVSLRKEMLASLAGSALSSVVLVQPEDLNFTSWTSIFVSKFWCWLFDCLAFHAHIWGSHFWNSRIQVSWWWCLDLPFLAVKFMSGGDPWCVSVRELPKDMASNLHHGRYDAWLRHAVANFEGRHT